MSALNLKLKVKKGILKLTNPITGGTEFDIETDEGTKQVECVLHLVGSHSKEYFNFLKKARENGWDIRKAFEPWNVEFNELIASVIIGWDDNGAFNTPWSAEAAREVILAEGNEWIIEQISTFLFESANFFTQSSKE